MAEYGEWNSKGASLSDKTAKKEMNDLKRRLKELQARKDELENQMKAQQNGRPNKSIQRTKGKEENDDK